MEEKIYGGAAASKKPERPLMEAMKRGFMGRCPSCGEGKLFCAYLLCVQRGVVDSPGG